MSAENVSTYYVLVLYRPACATAACTATAPSRVAGTGDSEPRNEPIGVLTALAITTSCTIFTHINYTVS